MKSSTATSFVVAMLALQVIAVILLWVLDVLTVTTTTIFSVLLAADFIAFAVTVEVYRNPERLEEKPAAPAQQASQQGPASQPVAAASPGTAHEEPRHEEPVATHVAARPALPSIVHIGVPIGSILVLLLFAILAFAPSYKAPLPPESTILFVPIYIMIVVFLVFGSIYLFKRLLDTEEVERKPEGSQTEHPGQQH